MHKVPVTMLDMWKILDCLPPLLLFFGAIAQIAVQGVGLGEPSPLLLMLLNNPSPNLILPHQVLEDRFSRLLSREAPSPLRGTAQSWERRVGGPGRETRKKGVFWEGLGEVGVLRDCPCRWGRPWVAAGL